MARKKRKKTDKETVDKRTITSDSGDNPDMKPEEDDASVQTESKTETAVEETSGFAQEKTGETAESDSEEKYAELNEKYVRLFAEYENYRKRTAREIGEIIQRGAEKLISELLPILDNLDRATEHRNDKTTFDEYVKGIALTEDQFRAILGQSGLEAIDAVGKPFDPNLHDALMQIESEDHESGIVASEIEKGYLLAGKVIRHSKVVVSK